MPDIDVDGFRYSFPDVWLVSKYDKWTFYREVMQSRANGAKAVDLIACGPAVDEVWLIEVKDYNARPRAKASDLHGEFESKVFWTLAAMTPARWWAEGADEPWFAERIRQAIVIRSLLHLEPLSGAEQHRGNPLNLANVLDHLRGRTRLSALGAPPMVVSLATSSRLSLPWTAARL